MLCKCKLFLLLNVVLHENLLNQIQIWLNYWKQHSMDFNSVTCVCANTRNATWRRVCYPISICRLGENLKFIVEIAAKFQHNKKPLSIVAKLYLFLLEFQMTHNWSYLENQKYCFCCQNLLHPLPPPPLNLFFPPHERHQHQPRTTIKVSCRLPSVSFFLPRRALIYNSTISQV